jgi:phosphatidylinositol alpha-1,6-mannosyltransferase
MLDSGLDVTATIVGDGREHAGLVALCRSAELTARVDFPGTVADRKVRLSLLDSAALFALPSRTEGVPRALIEAMARALPAVGTDIGGIPELLHSSCLVPAGDPRTLALTMSLLLVNQRIWEEQSQRNLETARTYEQARLDTNFSTWLAQVPSACSRRASRDLPHLHRATSNGETQP